MAVNPYTTTTVSSLTVMSPNYWSLGATTSSSSTSSSLGALTTTWTQPTTIAIGDVELTEETARKLVDLIEQLDRLNDSAELDAVAAGVAQEAECSKKEAKTTLVALRSLLNLAAIERKLEAV